MNRPQHFLSVLVLFTGLLAGLPQLGHALGVTPAAPTVAPGGTVKLTASNYTGLVNWFDLGANKSLGSGSTVTYTAPAQEGAYQVRVNDSVTQVTVTIRVLLASFAPENAQWEIYTDRSQIETLAGTEDGKTLWIGTTGGLEKRDAISGEVLQAFNTSNGLPNNDVSALLSDGAGGVWIGTDGGGVARLTADGKMTLYKNSNSENYVFSLLSDGADGLWIGTDGAGLARMGANGTWTPYTTSTSKLPNNWVNALLSDGAGGIWIGTGGGGLARRDVNGAWTIYDTNTSQLPHDNILTLLSDNAGGLWIGTNGGGLARLAKNGEWTVYNTTNTNSKLPSNKIVSLAYKSGGGLWIGTWGRGLVKMNVDGTWEGYSEYSSELPSNYITSLQADSAGGVWMGTPDTGLARLGINGVWTVYDPSSSGLPYNIIQALASDDEGGFWVGTGGGGLARRTADGKWTVYNDTDSELPSNYISALQSDGAGGVWVGTYIGLARLAADGAWTQLPNYFVGALLGGDPSGVWVGTMGNGLVWQAMDGSSVEYNASNSELPGDVVTALLSDGAGGVWVGTMDGLARRTADGVWTVYDTSNSRIPDNWVYSLHGDGADGVWIGTIFGVARLAADGAWSWHHTGNSEIPNDWVITLQRDGAGGLWIGTMDGLARLSPDGLQWTLYNQANSGLPLNSVYALLSDDKDGLWVGTYGGGLVHLTFGTKPDLCATTPEQCQTLYQQRRAGILIHSHGSSDGEAQRRNLEQQAAYAYRSLYRRGYDHDELYFISPAKGLDFNQDIFPDKNILDAPLPAGSPVSTQHVGAAFDWAKEKGRLDQPLIVTYLGHGLPGQLPLGSDTLSAQALKSLLDTYQSATGNAVVVILEACYSGSLAQTLAAPNRVVISSTGGDELAYYLGQVSFTGLLFDYLMRDFNFDEAWRNATSALYAYGSPFSRQQPQLKDLSGLAPAQCLNLCGLGDLVNVVLNVSLSAEQVVAGQSVTLSVTPLDSRVKNVSAEVVTPGDQWDEQGRPTGDTLKLTLVKGGGKWQLPLPYSPPQDGNYLFSVQAQDGGGNPLGDPGKVALRVGSGGPPPATGQCAVFDAAANPQVNIPCVSVNGTPYRAGLDLVAAPAGVTRFAVTSAEPASLTPGAECAVFPYGGQDVLRLNCVQVGADIFWAELGLVPGAADIQFDLSGADRR